jgi:hypothetical protein
MSGKTDLLCLRVSLAWPLVSYHTCRTPGKQDWLQRVVMVRKRADSLGLWPVASEIQGPDVIGLPSLGQDQHSLACQVSLLLRHCNYCARLCVLSCGTARLAHCGVTDWPNGFSPAPWGLLTLLLFSYLRVWYPAHLCYSCHLLQTSASQR